MTPPSDPKLERYLTSLESALRGLSVSDRADIVTEIKSHVLSALDRDPQGNLDTILSALGEPETVANRYLMERGLKPAKPPISPIVKWLVIGFLGTFAMILFFAGALIWKFHPLIKVNEQDDRVSLLGGMIEVDGKNDRVKIRGIIDIDGKSSRGASTLDAGKAMGFKFSQGSVEFSTADGGTATWSCTHDGGTKKKAIDPVDTSEGIALDLSHLKGVDCQVALPAGTRLIVSGQQGEIHLDEPRFEVHARLDDGRVVIDPNEDHAYRYKLELKHGKQDAFESSKDPHATLIEVQLGNGEISHD